ncbi:Hypothetical protein B839_07420 [Vibrio cholerae O1 str. Inaba G4222]|nr:MULTISPECIES: hypothetical protein [Gammaproteobacteria]EAZ77725.1 hypothetical protein A5E_0020 [Vibrio cholerae B33]EKK86330.1 hypothetical protein VCCP10336_0032 [Vibrio cholerae CP1033(6)]EMB03048.1 Hypothetical protein B839_07420 [Vibrio cholerae O1 str. Inaba G4222]EMP94369.1 hypothetical protein VCAG7404_002748 [Vibrio cholerae O1 str. AG-7404]EMQ01823.1 hypothetical protein VCAG8040_002881 [Vibrio cholerae O1 str. AG-8040]
MNVKLNIFYQQAAFRWRFGYLDQSNLNNQPPTEVSKLQAPT